MLYFRKIYSEIIRKVVEMIYCIDRKYGVIENIFELFNKFKN